MRLLDLFSGIGGFSLAAHWLGWQTVGFVEIDKFCQKVLSKNFPEVPIVNDIRNVSTESFQRPDIISGGFPCQPFSSAGKRKGTEDNRYLWPEMLRVIKEYKPTWIVGENVAGIISMALDDCLASLESEGYETQSLVIPACATNAPHRRDRVWILAYTSPIRQQQPQGHIEESRRRTSDGDQRAAADTAGKRRNGRPHGDGRFQESSQGGQEIIPNAKEAKRCKSCCEPANGCLDAWPAKRSRKQTISRFCFLDDGLSVRSSGHGNGGGNMDRVRVVTSLVQNGFLEIDFEIGSIYSRRIRGRSGEKVKLEGSNLKGYRVHKLYFEGQKYFIRAHQIIWFAANGAIPDGLMIDHKDRNRSNNSLKNLRLVDAKGNAENKPSQKGELNYTSKLSNGQRLEIFQLHLQGMKVRDIADLYGMGKSQINNIIHDAKNRRGWFLSLIPDWAGGDWSMPSPLVHGEKDRAAKLKALGNSIVPMVAYEIFRAIDEIENR